VLHHEAAFHHDLQQLKQYSQFEFKWPLDAPAADFDRVDAIAQRLRVTVGPS
jgi:hypothetical protein